MSDCATLHWQDLMPGAAHKYAKKRPEILKTAATAFRRRGYYGSSVDSIARAQRPTAASESE